jgi:hypothetical protein
MQPPKRPSNPNPKTDHLIPWVPGQSGNPAGRPKAAIGGAELARLIAKQFKTAKKDIQAILANDDLDAVQHMVARQIMLVIEKGDTHTFATLCDRAFGKQKERVETTINKIEAELEHGEKIAPSSIADFIRTVARAA